MIISNIDEFTELTGSLAESPSQANGFTELTNILVEGRPDQFFH